MTEYERALSRLQEVLDDGYDGPCEEDLSQPIRDLLTDVAHYCDNTGIDIGAALERALWMRDEERKDWGMAPVEEDSL